MVKDGGSGDDFSKESIERDERRLTEVGRRTIELFVISHIFSSKIKVEYQEAISFEKVIVRAHAVMANGEVIAPVGLNMVALASQRHAVAFVVLAGIHKQSSKQLESAKLVG
ncbi:MATH domain-containing protein [Tanacetum coccineum]